MQAELFSMVEQAPAGNIPLAARMRPRNMEELLGQDHLVGQGAVLRRAIAADQVPSLILWGPPGTGKTSLARVIARSTRANFRSVSAVTAGVADLRRMVQEAWKLRKATGRPTILFIDEIHHFNKAQQDVILPYVEDGVVTLIGTTTENPSFAVIAALLSRCRVCTLRPLGEAEIRQIIARTISDEERGLGTLNVELDEEALAALAARSDGDARVALNVLELAVAAAEPRDDNRRRIALAAIQEALLQRALLYDKSGDQHFDAISALHKSIRDSDPDAALYWLGRMLEAGEEPLYVARRLIRMASEDIGLADPAALQLAVAAQQAVHFLGMPEGNLALAEAATYLALAPKSNALYLAYGKVQEDIEKSRNEPVPLQIRNPATSLMKEAGYGQDYKYAHEHLPPDGMRSKLNQNLPPSLEGRRYYQPTSRGYEKKLRKRIKDWGATPS